MTSTDPFKSGLASTQVRISAAEERKREALRINEREKSRLLSIKAKLEAYPELRDYSVSVSEGTVRMLGDRIYDRETRSPSLKIEFRKMDTIKPIWRDESYAVYAGSGIYNEDGTYTSTSDEDILRKIGEDIGHLKKSIEDRRVEQPTRDILSYRWWIFFGFLIVLVIFWNQ